MRQRAFGCHDPSENRLAPDQARTGLRGIMRQGVDLIGAQPNGAGGRAYKFPLSAPSSRAANMGHFRC